MRRRATFFGKRRRACGDCARVDRIHIIDAGHRIALQLHAAEDVPYEVEQVQAPAQIWPDRTDAVANERFRRSLCSPWPPGPHHVAYSEGSGDGHN